MKCKYKKFLKAAYINYDEDYCGCGLVTFTKPAVTTPIIVITGNIAIIACAISGVTIYYTLDGSTPTSSSTKYTGTITLTLSCTIKAIAVKSGMTNSEVASESYVHYLTQWKIVGNSEVHTLPYPDGVVLPNGYKRCKYLTFDGASYLNIGKVFDTTSICNTKFATETKGTILIGGRAPSKYNFGIGVFGGNNNDNYTLLAHYTAGNYVNTGKLWNGEPHNIILQHRTATIDNHSVNIVGNDISVEKLDIYIGTWSNNGTPDSRYFVGDIYDTVISDGTTETWHGIPCLDANDVPCFYDIISQTAFYNQGSGSFTYELYPQPTEIWSCGEYSAVDGKYHILVQPQGGSIVDIALTEPLRKVNDVADTIEFPSGTEGKALVTRNLGGDKLKNFTWNACNTKSSASLKRWGTKALKDVISGSSVILTIEYTKGNTLDRFDKNYSYDSNDFFIYDEDYNTKDSYNDFIAHINNYDIIYEFITPTTELVDAPQIEEADSYTCVISQGGKAVSWSSFETE